MKKDASRLPPRQRAEIEALAALPDDRIDTSDVPEVIDWSGMKRGLFYRPVKKQITLRIDSDVIEWFRRHTAKDEGYQTNMNRALREHVERHHRQRASATRKRAP